ncbi:hypothetical protein Q8F55_006121 [Vanrija albida]|uniref:Ricin B lectin domain-containing protein n=1 Tax=Vanrija albida TaxID=181172 RepID=A0ABR3Q3Q5_9TREE
MLALLVILALAAVSIASPLDKRQRPPGNPLYIRPVLAPAGQSMSLGVGRDNLHTVGMKYVNPSWLPPPSGWGQVKLWWSSGETGLDKCLDAGLTPGNGVRLKVWDCYDVPQQKWWIHDGQIQLAGTNLCVDVTDGRVENANVVQLWQCYDGNQNQQFRLTSSFTG